MKKGLQPYQLWQQRTVTKYIVFFSITESVSGLTTTAKFSWEEFTTVFAILKLSCPSSSEGFTVCRVLTHTAVEY
jgi:hypothetical protein